MRSCENSELPLLLSPPPKKGFINQKLFLLPTFYHHMSPGQCHSYSPHLVMNIFASEKTELNRNTVVSEQGKYPFSSSR